MTKNKKLIRLIFMAMMIATGVVISPILRVEGMCPMAHLINVTCAVFLGPFPAFLCAALIGIIRMIFMGIPPLALTGAIFGAFFSGLFYRMSKGNILFAVLGEIFGTGIIGAIISYPVMTYIWGRSGLTWFFYVPSFIAGTLIGGSIAFILIKQLNKIGQLTKIQKLLGSEVYINDNDTVKDALSIAFVAPIAYLAALVIENNLVSNPDGFIPYIKYITAAAFLIAAAVYYILKKPSKQKGQLL